MDIKSIPIQGPGLWFGKNKNNIILVYETSVQDGKNRSIMEYCKHDNVPIGEWFNIVIVTFLKRIELYINGRLTTTCVFKGLPITNYGNLYFNAAGGFKGELKCFRYINKKIRT